MAATGAIDCNELLRGTLARKYANAMSPEAAEYLAKIDPEDADARNRFLRMVDRPKFRELIFEYFLSSILSAPPTHIRNVVGNTSYATAEVPTRAVQGGIDALLTGMRLKPEREVFAGEAGYLVRGALSGIPDGMARFAKVFDLTRDVDLLSGKLGGVGGAFQAPTPAHSRLQSRAGRAVGDVVTTPLRALTAEDLFAKTVAAAAEEHAWAYRAARKEGLSGDALDERVTELLVEKPEEMIEAGRKLAERVTFTDTPSWFAQGLAAFRGAPGRAADQAALAGNRVSAAALGTADLLLKATVPFINVPDRLIVRGLEYTPVGLARGLGQLVPALRAGESTIQATDLLARGTMGSVLAFTLGTAFGNERFTGAAPREQGAREAFYASGKKPWAIKIGDTWVPFGRTDPLGNALGLISVFADGLGREMTDDESIYERATEIAVEFGQMMLDKGTMTGISDLLEVFQTGGYGAPGDRLKQYLARQSGALVPWSGMQRTVAQMMRPGLVEREGPLDWVKESIPPNPLTPDRGDLAPRVDRFGQQIQVAEHNPIAKMLGEMFGADPNRFAPLLASGTPLDLSTEAEDPIRSMLENLPGRTRGPAPEAAVYGPIEREELERLYNSPGFAALTDKGKQIAVERAKKRARQRYQQTQGGMP